MSDSGLPELDVARVRRWAERQVPAEHLDRVRVECQLAPRHLTIVERTPPWQDAAEAEWIIQPVARLRYTKMNRRWTLYWPDRNSRFHIYQQLDPSPRVADLLAEIDADPTAIFWG